MQTIVRYVSQQLTRTWCLEAGRLRETEAASRACVVAVVDVPDESYVTTTLPRIRGRDAALLRRRRLEREFPGASLTLMQVLRRRAGGGGLEAVMLAVNGGPTLDDALKTLANEHMLRAVTTPALLAGEWLRRARAAAGRRLIVMPTPAGVRQMFFDEGRPILSRLTAPATPAATANEIVRTVQYLQNSQRIARGEQVELWFWGMDDDTAAACVPTGVAVNPGAAPCVAGLPDPEREGFDALVQLAAQSPGRLQLAPDALRLGWIARGLERSAWRAAAGVILLAIGVAGLLEWRTARLHDDVAAATAQRQAVESAMVQAQESLREAGLSLADVAALPEVLRTIRRGAVDFTEVLGVVGAGFAAHSDVIVQRIEMSAAPLADFGDTSTAESVSTPADPLYCDGDASGAATLLAVEFALTPNLDIRSHATALEFVRTRAASLPDWIAGAAVRSLGQSDALVVTDDGASAASAEGRRWTVCLQRGST